MSQFMTRLNLPVGLPTILQQHGGSLLGRTIHDLTFKYIDRTMGIEKEQRDLAVKKEDRLYKADREDANNDMKKKIKDLEEKLGSSTATKVKAPEATPVTGSSGFGRKGRASAGEAIAKVGKSGKDLIQQK